MLDKKNNDKNADKKTTNISIIRIGKTFLNSLRFEPKKKKNK